MNHRHNSNFLEVEVGATWQFYFTQSFPEAKSSLKYHQFLIKALFLDTVYSLSIVGFFCASQKDGWRTDSPEHYSKYYFLFLIIGLRCQLYSPEDRCTTKIWSQVWPLCCHPTRFGSISKDEKMHLCVLLKTAFFLLDQPASLISREDDLFTSVK